MSAFWFIPPLIPPLRYLQRPQYSSEASYISSSIKMTLQAEQESFEVEAAAVKQWWSQPRWRYTKRPFTAEQIVSKRGNLLISYPSNDQSKKVWEILEGRFAAKEASITYGCLDPVMVTQMAKYLETVYVSGWQCSSTASSTHEPSPDLADYPMVCVIHSFW